MCLGCQSDVSHSSVWEKWAIREGGFASPSSQARAQTALNALQFNSQEVRVYVLQSPGLTACAWPDGSVFLTSALVELLEPQEISAVIAHELGHLRRRPLSGNASALLGKPPHLDDESRADEFAAELLHQSGIAPHALAAALRKVQSTAQLSDPQRESLARRANHLDSWVAGE